MKKNPITEAIKEVTGMTATSWAKRNGFKPKTLASVVGEFSGKRRIGITADIFKALKRQGILKVADQIKASM